MPGSRSARSIRAHAACRRSCSRTTPARSARPLPVKIGFIRHIFVGLNTNSAEKWDICLDSEFDTLADVNAYAVHPDHVAAAGLLKEVKADRACVDYEL